MMGYRRSPLNRRLCTYCIRGMHKQAGGAEVEISLLFADVRGSTSLAERMPPGEFSRMMARFYDTATRVVDASDGIVDKFVGDEAVALFIPGFAGGGHAGLAIAAARGLLRETGHKDGEPWAPVGAGVHTGVAFVGAVGDEEVVDFTALGDSVNTAARLASSAGAGEVLVSAAAAAAGELETTGLERRTLSLRGREQAVEAWVVGP
jgi:adenylate cyclase